MSCKLALSKLPDILGSVVSERRGLENGGEEAEEENLFETWKEMRDLKKASNKGR
jgi:hypothetical protein